MTVQALKNAFEDCNRADTLCTVKSSYEAWSLSEFYIIDDRKGHPVRISTNETDNHLTVTNDTGDQIDVVKLDCCLFHGEGHKRCDCLLFNSQKAFLVELKDPANSGGRSACRDEAVRQLKATLEILKEKKVDLSILAVEAVICLSFRKTYPTQASGNSNRAFFQAQYNVHLTEGNSISF